MTIAVQASDSMTVVVSSTPACKCVKPKTVLNDRGHFTVKASVTIMCSHDLGHSPRATNAAQLGNQWQGV